MDSQDSSFYPVICHNTFTDPRNFDNLPARHKQLVIRLVEFSLGRGVDWSKSDEVELVYDQARHMRIAHGWFDFGLLDNRIENPAINEDAESVGSNAPDSQPLSEHNWP